ncbi:MAG: HNH endonuclease [Magnetococcales bacterium]|nr:HNH endonuclease [Magnetococcales bacterium]
MLKMNKLILAAALAVLVALPLDAFSATRHKKTRMSATKIAFMKANPCPSNGKSKGSCPGYGIGYVIPLKQGGVDSASNMQWVQKKAKKVKKKMKI